MPGGDGDDPPAPPSNIEIAKLTSSLMSGCPILQGNEGIMERTKWAGHMKHVIKYWPIQTCSTVPLFDIALTGQAWRDYSAMDRKFKIDDDDYDGEEERAFAYKVIQAFEQVSVLPDIDILKQVELLTQGPTIQSASELDACYNTIIDEASRFNFDAEIRSKLVLSALLRRLPDSLSFNLRTQGVTSPEQARDAARRALPPTDNLREDTNIAAAIGQEATQQAPPVADATQVLSEQAAATIKKQQEDLDALRQELEKMKMSAMCDSQRGRKAKPHKVNVIESGQRQGSNQREACQICGKNNHSAIDCYDPRNPAAAQNRARLGRQRFPNSSDRGNTSQQRNQSGMSCQLCSGTDHLASACNRKERNGQKQFTCYTCGQEGHTSRYCRNSRRSSQGARSAAPRNGFQAASSAPYVFQYPPQGHQHPPYPYPPMAYQYPPPPWANNVHQAPQNGANFSVSQSGNR